MTLSQIVHLRVPSQEYALRGMLNRTLILITRRRLIAYAPILQSVCVVR